VIRAVRVGGLVLAAQARLQDSEVGLVHVPIIIHVSRQAVAGDRTHSRPGGTALEQTQIGGIHVSVAVVVAKNDWRATVRIDRGAGNGVGAGVHVVADAIAVGIADAGRRRDSANCQPGTHEAKDNRVCAHLSISRLGHL